MSTGAEIKQIARELDDEPSHCFQVCKIALQLYDSLEHLHTLDDEARAILEAGALLHDTGHSIDMRKHHKHSRDIILRTELPGFTDRTRKMVACVARYHRKAHPREDHRVYRDLAKADRHIVRKLAALLRIADGLDRCHGCHTRRVTAVDDGGTVTLTISQAQPNDTDVWGAERKSALFEEVYERKIEFTVEAGA